MEKLLNKNNLFKTLGLFGLADSLYLTYVKIANPSSVLFCNTSDSCSKVQTGEYSTILGIPVALLGVFYYLVFLVLSSWHNKKYFSMWLVWGLLFSLYLVYLQLFVIGSICIWCVFSFVAIVLSVMIFWFMPKQNSNEEVL